MIVHVSGYKTLIINQRLARVSLQSVGPVLHKWSADQKRIFNILADFLGIPLRENHTSCVCESSGFAIPLKRLSCD